MNTYSTKQRFLQINSLVQPGRLLLTITVSCLVTSLVVFGGLQFQTAKTEAWVQHSELVRLESQNLLIALLDAETGVRGYDISHRQEFLTSYQKAVVIIPNSLERLTHLVADNPSQSQKIKEIKALYFTKIALLNRNIQFINSQPPTAEIQPELVSILLEGKQVMEQARTQLNRFIAEEERLQIDRATSLKQQRQLTWLALILSAVFGISGALITASRWNRLNQKLRERDYNLRDSEKQYRTLVENFPNGYVLLFNTELRYLIAGGIELLTVGLSQAQLEGKTIWEALSPETCELIEPIYRNVIAGHEAIVEIPYADRIYLMYALPVKHNNGEVYAGMVMTQNITKQKQAEQEIIRLNKILERRVVESEARYQQIVELAEEGIWVVDHEVKTIYVNQAMLKLLGYRESEILGRPIFDFISIGKNSKHCLLNFGNLTQVEKCEQLLKTASGQDLWVYLSTSPLLDEKGKMSRSYILVHDITERKQAEALLQESSERISLVNAELARATRLKDEFLASMSHELRTPLNAILGLSEALQEEVYGSLTPKQHQSLSTIESSGRHLLELITDILDLSKIESGKMELQIAPVSLESLCESSLTFVRQQAHQKNIMLNFKSSPLREIEVDERRIRQVLVNLLSNAVKFTPEGGEVRLEVEVDSDAAILQLSVIDTGIGIAPENIDKLFQPFMQLDSSLSRRYAGTGLGLALVRRLVELHEGSVTLESTLEKGSRFTVTLPWKEAQIIQNLRQIEQTELNWSSLNQALIIEDSDTAAKQVARYLGELGVSTTIYPVGEGSIEVAQRLLPDVIILDLLLPQLSGWEVLHQLKAKATTQHIPVLITSVVDERLRALELGASDYLVKPIFRQQFQLSLRKIFAKTFQSSSYNTSVIMQISEQQLPLILLAEDNETNIATLRDYLHIQDYQVSLARNGREAVEMAKQQKPNLILMDIQMPEMDGLEATYRIQADTETANIPIIALTALAMPGDKERCLAAGAKAYLTKPVSLKKLQNIITQHLNPVS